MLESLNNKVSRDLHLSTYETAEDIFRVLENRFGNRAAIALEIVEELQAMPPVRSQQLRKIVDLIQVVERALHDLRELRDTGAVRSPLVTKSIESKLPESLKKEWLTYTTERSTAEPRERFDMLFMFLKSQEELYEQLELMRDDEPSRREA